MLKILALALLLASGTAFASGPPSPTTKTIPPVITIIPTAPLQIEASKKEEQRHGYSSAEWWIVWVTGWLVLITGTLAWFTYGLWSGAEESTNQAVRAADAMSRVATAAEQNALRAENIWRKQMRAYLAVDIGFGIYQERTKGLRFEAKPTLTNCGHTPAHKLDYWARADILPYPLPDDFDFPRPADISKKSFVLSPNHPIALNAVVDDYVPDGEVAAIKYGRERRLYIWGEITYEDVFGEHHITKFCQSLYWYGIGRDEKIGGAYAEKFNEAT